LGTQPGSVEWALQQPYPRFLIDHNNPWVFGAAFRIAGYAAVAAKELGLQDEDDPVVIEYCGRNSLVWITEDFDARRRGQYAALVRKHRVSAVLLRPPSGKGWPTKTKFEVIARNLRRIEAALVKSDPRYFICTEQRIREVPTFSATLRPRRK
jgi:predicted nuclease of predicted toxin-antitoxin system